MTVKILVVDDEPANLIAFREILQNPSYEVITVSDPYDALKQLLVNEFAVLLLDVFMEKMDGLELATMVKAREKTRFLPIIFLTAARADQEFIHRAYESGAADFIEKPVAPEIVQAKVAVFVDLYLKRKQVERQSELLHESEVRERETQLHEVRTSGEKRFQDLVEGIDHGFVWSADPKTLTFSYISPRAELILGQLDQEWKERPGLWLNQIHPDDRKAVEETFTLAQTGKDVSLEHRFIRSDGEIIWLHTGVRLARRGTGVGTELRGLSIDITYLKEIEAALKEAVRARDDFLLIASHELKTPLTPILLQLQLLERAMQKGNGAAMAPERLMKTLDSWRKQVNRLNHLIEDMLDLSRISAGKIQLQPEETDLRTVIDELIDQFRPQGLRVGSEILVTGSDHVKGTWDGKRLEQIFTNLISNAIKYAPGKPIEVEIVDQDESVTVIVQDHGSGIPPEKQAKIFERFERGNAPTHVSGLGLGLYIAKNIVEAHHGTISVESDAAKGTKFTVILPKRLDVEKIA